MGAYATGGVYAQELGKAAYTSCWGFDSPRFHTIG